MADIKITEANGLPSFTKATGTGESGDPKIPQFALIDPISGKVATIREAEWGEALLGIHNVHAHSSPFSTHLSRETGTSTTIASAVSPGDYIIAVTDSTGITAGSKIELGDTAKREPNSIKVTAVNGNNLTLAKHIDKSYAVGANVIEVDIDMAVSGSMISPQNYRYNPRPGKVMHLEYISIYIRSSTQPYDSDFGDIDELINGVHIRKYNGGSSDYQTVHMLRSNRRMVLQGFNVRYGDRSSPADAYSTHGIFNYLNNTSGMIRLDDNDGDYFQCMIHDDLTGLDYMEIMVGGHEEI